MPEDTKSTPQLATFEDLVSKPRRISTFSIALPDGNGGTVTRTLRFRSIPSPEYDRLVAKHPPTPAQKSDGAVLNIDTFAPALISAVSFEPELSYDQVEQLYNSPEWSGGEFSSLYLQAQRVCNAGIDVPFNGNG